jgi:hypothetical protein
LDHAVLAAYAGRYALDAAPEVMVSIWVNPNGAVSARWSGQPRLPILACAANEFFYKENHAVRISFHREADGTVNRLTLHERGDHAATRIRGDAVKPSDYGIYEGVFYSSELDATYTIALENNELVAHTAPMRHVAPLKAVHQDVFTLPSGDSPGNFIFVPSGKIVFQRDAAGRISGFLLSGDRVTNVAFTLRNPDPKS